MATLVVSYSRADQALVRAVVALLKSALRDVERAVFWDADIEPGDEWWAELQRGIDETPQLFVFWCDHSLQSKEVRREFTYALGRGKRVVPVLLDYTPLPAELTVINGIDLRQAVRHLDSETTGRMSRIEPPLAQPDSEKTVRMNRESEPHLWRRPNAIGVSRRFGLGLVLSMVLSMPVVWWLLHRGTDGAAEPGGPGVHGVAAFRDFVPLVVVVLSVIVLGWMFGRRASRSAPDSETVAGYRDSDRVDEYVAPLSREGILDEQATVRAFSTFFRTVD